MRTSKIRLAALALVSGITLGGCAYGFDPSEHVLASVLALNAQCDARAKKGETVRGPGLPAGLSRDEFVSIDRVAPPSAWPG